MKQHSTFWVALWLAGCTGQVTQNVEGMAQSTAAPEREAEGEDGGQTYAPDEPSKPPTDVGELDTLDCEQSSAAPAFRLLTRAEYAKTIRALGGAADASSLLPDGRLHDEGFFVSNAGLHMDEQRLLAFEQTAAAQASAVADNLSEEAGCGGLETSCLEGALEHAAFRIFRRPIGAAELTSLQELYQNLLQPEDEAASSPQAAFAEVTGALLQTPDFLYHHDRTSSETLDDGSRALEPYALASRLAYFVTGAPADETLRSAAAAGELEDESGVEAWTRTLIKSAAGQAHLVHQVERWAQLPKLAASPKSDSLFPNYSHDVAASFAEASQAFVSEHIVEDGAAASQWLLAPHAFEEVPAYLNDPAHFERQGLLMQPAWLAGFAGPDANIPTARGKFIVEELLCFHVPDPPADLEIPEIPEPNSEQTTRERFEMHNQMPCAQGCHSIMDPPGFAFEHFAADGRWQDEENGKPIDASGKLNIGQMQDAFDGANELVELVASSSRYQTCLSQKWLEVALARPINQADDCAVAQIAKRFENGPAHFSDLIVAITTSNAFRARRPQ